MRLDDATAITKRCFHGNPASCSHPCPFFFDIRTFLERVKTGKWSLAYKLLRNAVVFPGIVCELCGAPCMSECQRAALGDEALAVRELEAACIRFARDRRPESFRIPEKDESAAVIGAGLAGLSCALNLAQKKYRVTVFDKGKGPGGSLVSHPLYETFREEILLECSASKITWAYGSEVSSPLDPRLACFDAVYLATGRGTDGFGLLDTWNPATLALGVPGEREPGAGSSGGASAANPKRTGFFAGGELCGMDKMQSIACGIRASKGIETWLQTRSAETLPEAEPKPELFRMDHTGKPKSARLAMRDPEAGYSKEEAQAEAARCMGCDCRNCLDACEMLNSFNKRPQKIAVEAFMDTKANPPFSSCSLTRETYSCNLCGYCKTVCPADIDMGALFHLARTGRAETGKYPAAFHDFWLRDFAWHSAGNAYLAPPKGKAAGETAAGGYIFFPGCKLGSRDPAYVTRSVKRLSEDFGAGVMLDCCGAPAYWAGETECFRSHTEKIRRVHAEMGAPVFVFACAYCMRIFKEFLPEIEMLSLYELLPGAASAVSPAAGPAPAVSSAPSLAPAPAVSPAPGPAPVYAVFDPCTARDFPRMQTAVRTLAIQTGAAVRELPDKNRCCGFGGHMRAANPDLYDKIVDHRTAADSAPYLVYCANCADAFERQGKDCLHILDLLYARAEGAPGRARGEAGNLSLQGRRENAERTKRDLMIFFEGKEDVRETKPWDDLRLLIQDELLREMDSKLIMMDDIKEAVYTAETTGEKFCFRGGGEGNLDEKDEKDEEIEIVQCCLIKPLVIYWVQYRTPPGSESPFEILDVYSHRMHFSKEE
ncbi:MAG: FAD-dependent oxidoreductase [Clostridiales Family XIII bacterium]|jgi:Fe-S oxidoreductase|nr:FAD-dependent oxidoreductase [Clostridiales Family XIII bacterium]